MCWFFIVIKLLMLKILLAGLMGLITASRYDYGYHPSAEEFDNLLRETRRTWTHTFLKADRDRLLTNPIRSSDNLEIRAKTESRYFVPKFQYANNEHKRFQSLITNPSHHNNYDLHTSSSQKHPVPLQNIGSTLDFNYFNNELPQPLDIQQSLIRKPNIVSTTQRPPITENKPITSALPEINLKPIAKPDIFNSNKYSLNNIYKNNSQGHFPIYFTNPATGIVYAITEVGKSTQNITRTNGSIPIFITKEQYERDIFQLKNEYEQKCQNFPPSTTARPQIIRIQKKPSPALDITSSKFTSPTASPANTLHKPSPVVVKTELTVKDKKPTTTHPLRKKKKKTKLKRKLKKQNPPGRKPYVTTIRPLLANQPLGPAIIMGSRTTTRKPLINNDKLPTQLEKPNFDIFSSSVATQTPNSQTGSLNPNLFIDNNHKINKRELLNISPIKRENSTKELKKSETTNFVSKDLLNKLKNAEIDSHNMDHELKVFLNEQLRDINMLREENNTTKLTNKLLKTSNNMIPKDLFKNNFRKDFKDFLKESMNSSIKNSSANNSYSEMLNKLTSENFVKETYKNRFKNSNSDSKFLKNIKKFQQNKGNSDEVLKNEQFTNDFNNSNLKKVLKFSNPYSDFKSADKINEFKNLTNNQKLKMQNFTSSNSNKFIKHKENISNNYSVHKISIDLKNLKHHINKRSATNITTNNQIPKFIKKSNTNQITAKNYTIQNQDLKRNLKINNPKFRNNSILSNKNTKNPGNTKGSLKRGKHLKKRKRLVKLNKNLKLNQTQTKQKLNQINPKPILTTTPRTINMTPKNNKKLEKKSERQDNEYYFFGIGESYDYDEEEEDDDDDEGAEDEEENEREEEYDDDDDDDEEDENERNEIFAYDEIYDSSQPHTSEVISVSMEELSEKPTQEVSSSPEEDNDIPAVEIQRIDLKTPVLDYDQGKVALKTKSGFIKKRIRRRPAQFKIDNDYYEEDDDDENSMSSNLSGFFRMIFYPIQAVMSTVMDSIAGKDAEDEEDDDPNFNPYTQYTSYHNTLKQQTSDEYDEDYDSNESGGSSLSSWFGSWFGLNRRNKKIGSTTVAPVQAKPTKASSSSWLPSWLGFGANDRVSTESASTEDYDEYDKWFASWFGETKPKARKRTTTTTTTTTQIPQVPILTIVDPMKNPQNWIGILAHHIINHTSTANPIKDMWNKVTTTTTTDNPEIPKKISYDKYQIWRLKPQDDTQVKALEEYKKSEDGIKLQWLKGPSLRGLTDVLVPPKMLVDFQASLTFELIDHEVLIFDVGKAIAYEKTKEDYFFTTTQKPKKHNGKLPTPGMTWHKYYEYDDIIKYLESMRMRFPHLVELIHIGRSYEGRPLIVTKIESKEAAAVNTAHYPAHQRNKLRHKKRIGLANAVFIEAGTHGMEWIGPATATWIINELLRIMKKNVSDDQSFIRNTTWYVMPVLNPDGYVYSHEYDRFWKKSRSRHISRPTGILNSAMTWLQKKRAKEKVCFGVDLDRNWHYQWGRRGSSKSPCNEFYAGPSAFSEPETKALSEFLMDYKTQIKLFVSMQAYGQIISYPYKANTTYDTERLDDLLDVAMVGTDGLRKKGSKSRYKIDSTHDLIENRSGCSDAFAAYEASIPFSYTLQLADNGVHGYLLPSASIESTAKDSFEIISGMLDYI